MNDRTTVSAPTLSVALPTYKRPDMLRQCLASLLAQSVLPREIAVGCREDDVDSRAVLDEYHHSSRGIVRAALIPPGANLVASLNAAVAGTTGDLVALTDDDAEFPADWIERLAGYFADPAIGGVGGRDNQAVNPGSAVLVGRLQWFGRIIGNHHLGEGSIRDVEVLKGVNCCFRGDELREIGFDQNLRGMGNVANWELALCFAMLRRGWRLVYDPALQITHHTAPRHDGDDNCRGGFTASAHSDAIHNETLSLLRHLPLHGRIALLAWSTLVGTRMSPGLLGFFVGVPVAGPRLSWQRFVATMSGRLRGIHSWWFDRGGVSPMRREGSIEPHVANLRSEAVR